MDSTKKYCRITFDTLQNATAALQFVNKTAPLRHLFLYQGMLERPAERVSENQDLPRILNLDVHTHRPQQSFIRHCREALRQRARQLHVVEGGLEVSRQGRLQIQGLPCPGVRDSHSHRMQQLPWRPGKLHQQRTHEHLHRTRQPGADYDIFHLAS